jgi:NAD(P)-dependent dehydrogenase (short-subunit alcohol dehydrogenase family)
MRIIRGRKALVTGAASGIGRSVALALAREGADLFLIDIDSVNLEQTAREAAGLGRETITAVCDLSQPAQIEWTLEGLLHRWGRLNILVNNAGVLHYGPTHRMTAEQWQSLLSINLLADQDTVADPARAGRSAHSQCVQPLGARGRAQSSGVSDQQICARRLECSLAGGIWRHWLGSDRAVPRLRAHLFE